MGMLRCLRVELQSSGATKHSITLRKPIAGCVRLSQNCCIVLGSGQVLLIHANADGQQHVGEALLIGGLDREDMIGSRHGIIEGPFFDGLEFQT